MMEIVVSGKDNVEFLATPNRKVTVQSPRPLEEGHVSALEMFSLFKNTFFFFFFKVLLIVEIEFLNLNNKY